MYGECITYAELLAACCLLLRLYSVRRGGFPEPDWMMGNREDDGHKGVKDVITATDEANHLVGTKEIRLRWSLVQVGKAIA